MKKLLALVLLVSFTFMMSGCNGVTMSDNMVGNLGDDVSGTAVHISDSATAKQALLEKSRQVRDKQYADAYKESGMKMKWVVVEEKIQMPGMKEPIIMTRMLPEVSFKEKPDFGRPVPDSPTDHPFWAASKSWVHDIITGAIFITGINAAKDVLTSVVTSPKANTYNGPVNMNNSQNTAGGAQTFDGSGQAYQIGDKVEPSVVPEVITPTL